MLKKGFTLIELLIVIAIIGILASVILASLNTARDKGKNSKIKAQLSSARNSAELFFDDNASYNGSVGDVSGDCTAANSMFADTTSNMADHVNLANYPVGTTLTCYSTATTWAISASLAIADSEGDTWCVDYNGSSKGITGAVTGPQCP